jgi:hypothetical protein
VARVVISGWRRILDQSTRFAQHKIAQARLNDSFSGA